MANIEEILFDENEVKKLKEWTFKIERFLYWEQKLLDESRYDDWLNLLDDEIRYFIPIEMNLDEKKGGMDKETKEGGGISWFEDDKWTITQRIRQLQTGIHWVEVPVSRVARITTNVLLLNHSTTSTKDDIFEVSSRVIVYQNREETETYLFVCSRSDKIIWTDGRFKILHRKLKINQNVGLAKAFSIIL